MKHKIYRYLTSLPIWARCILGVMLLPLCFAALPLVFLAVVGETVIDTVEDFFA